jgi:exodeoxyribonuclease VII large subunit
MGRAMARARELRGERLGAVAARLPSPRALLALKAQHADDVGFRLPRALNANTAIHAGRYQRSGAVLRPALLVQRRDRAADVVVLVGQKLGVAYQAALAKRRSELEADKCRIRPFVMKTLVDRKTAQVGELQRVLASLDPKATLKRGYAVVTDGAGRYITGVAAAKAAGAMTLEFADGAVGVATGTAPGDGAPRRSSTRPGVRLPGTQGDLF